MLRDTRPHRREETGPGDLLASFRVAGRPRAEVSAMPASPPPAPSWGSLPAPLPTGRVANDRHPLSVSGRAGSTTGAAALGAAGAAAAAGSAAVGGTSGQSIEGGSGGPDAAARSRPRSSFGANDAMETVKLLAAGGMAGAVSKSATAPLARLTILYQARAARDGRTNA